MTIIDDFLRALRDPRTYWPPRNVYAAFGFLWGLPIPVFSISLHTWLGGNARAIFDAWPVHAAFALHPLLFLVVFGAMGTMRRWKEEELQRNADTDMLTGLVNRRACMRRLDVELTRARRTGQPLAVAMIDLDHFKPVNDQLGHLAGDEILREAARRLDAARRSYDVLARFGGDEFVLICPNTAQQDAVAAADRARQAIAGSGFVVKGTVELARLSATIGIAEFPNDAGDADSLLRRADEAMYRAKEAGRNCVRTSREAGTTA